LTVVSTTEPDPIIVLGAVVARELYGVELPVVALDEEDYRFLRPGDVVSVDATGDPGNATLRFRRENRRKA
jgi:predicted aconitase with swiveling domain